MQFPKKTISASSMMSYYDCPLQWKLINVDGLQPKEGDALFFGSIFDTMVKTFHTKNDLESAIEFARVKHLGTKPVKKMIDHFGKCRQLLEIYAKTPYNFSHPQFDIRFRFTLTHPITGKAIEYPLTGILDGLDTIVGGVKPVEYKTSAKDYTQEQIDKSLQASFYGYYAHRTSGQNDIDIDYVVANKGKKTFQFLTTHRKKEDFITLFEKVEQFIDDVRQEKFDENPNHPFWCQCHELRKWSN